MKSQILLPVIILAVFVAGRACAGDKPFSEQEIKSLIQQLVSPNHAPKIDGPAAIYPAGYNREANSRVIAAWLKLQKSGLQAFPYLFDYFDDERYSFTQDAGPADFNWSVGLASFDIVRYQLFPLHSSSVSSNGDRSTLRPSYWTHYNLRTPAGAKAWWKTHQQKSLRELQIEVFEWIIAEETKTPDRYSDRERTHLQGYLKVLHDKNMPLEAETPWVK